MGSHLVDALAVDGWEITVLDDLSAGTRGNLSSHRNSKRFSLLVGDCTRAADVGKALKDADVVFHLAANPEVRLQLNDPETCFRQNVYATHVVLEKMRTTGGAKRLVFASTSTVYGDAEVIPTPENYSPLEPISLYGGSKLACEAMISSYCHSFGWSAVALRLANVIGGRSNHGVIADFISKLKRNPRRLEVLGDGTQTKSYIHIDDCCRAILEALRASSGPMDIFNVGSEDKISVSRIAEIVIEEMGLENETAVRFTGGVGGGRGWVGDVKHMMLDIGKLKSRGWSPRHSSEESVRLATRAILGRWRRRDPRGAGSRGLRAPRTLR